jgi:hypothetical protein
MDRGHLGYVHSPLTATCPGMWETNQTPAITLDCYVCFELWGENVGVAGTEFDSQRQIGTSVTGDCLSNTHRTSVLGVTQYRV